MDFKEGGGGGGNGASGVPVVREMVLRGFRWWGKLVPWGFRSVKGGKMKEHRDEG